MEKSYTFCQSCGMMMEKDPLGGGKEKDGTRSKKYCSNCYHEGAFTFNCTVKQLQDYVMKILVMQRKLPIFFAQLLTNKISSLERWQTNESRL